MPNFTCKHTGPDNSNFNGKAVAPQSAPTASSAKPTENADSSKEPADYWLPVHSLYAGSRDGGTFTDADRLAVITTVSAAFDNFTVIDANGYFKGRSVATLVLKIASDDQIRLEALAHSLGVLLGQEAIGLETYGQYRSITMD
jgi:hypothetical protein